jgi:hypothetical protein
VACGAASAYLPHAAGVRAALERAGVDARCSSRTPAAAPGSHKRRHELDPREAVPAPRSADSTELATGECQRTLGSGSGFRRTATGVSELSRLTTQISSRIPRLARRGSAITAPTRASGSRRVCSALNFRRGSFRPRGSCSVSKHGSSFSSQPGSGRSVWFHLRYVPGPDGDAGCVQRGQPGLVITRGRGRRSYKPGRRDAERGVSCAAIGLGSPLPLGFFDAIPRTRSNQSARSRDEPLRNRVITVSNCRVRLALPLRAAAADLLRAGR